MPLEITLLASYESKLREARRIIGEARNYSLNLIPINLLPSEVLMHIFHLLTAEQPCHLKQIASATTGKPYLMYPSCLTRVCSRWRQIAIASSSLWVHVDLALNKPPHQSSWSTQVDRVRTYATRSGELPLQIHITGQETLNLGLEELYINDLLRLLVSRMESLEFAIHRRELDQSQSSALSTLLSSCTPETFKKLTLSSAPGHYDNYFLGTTQETLDAGWHSCYLQLSLSHNQLERSLRHVSVLHLGGVFPRWTSVAYHGLVDLRLTSAHQIYWSSIEEAALVEILRASLGLRILYLELEVTNPLPDMIPVTPITLEHLEVLSLVTDRFSYREDEYAPADAGKLLRYFAPGPLPLRFIFQTAYYANDRAFEEVEKFFMRSNIVKFCSRDAYPTLDGLLSHAPNLQTLVFHLCARRKNSLDLVSEANQNARSATHPNWDSWHMRYCQIDINDLSQIVRLYPREIVLAGCDIYRNLPESTDKEEVPEEELWGMFPSVRFIRKEECHDLPEPTKDWDVLD